MTIYLSGVAFNLLIIINIFRDGEFLEDMNNNFPLTVGEKLGFLSTSLLSWLIPIYLIIRKSKR